MCQPKEVSSRSLYTEGSCFMLSELTGKKQMQHVGEGGVQKQQQTRKDIEGKGRQLKNNADSNWLAQVIVLMLYG